MGKPPLGHVGWRTTHHKHSELECEEETNHISEQGHHETHPYGGRNQAPRWGGTLASLRHPFLGPSPWPAAGNLVTSSGQPMQPPPPGSFSWSSVQILRKFEQQCTHRSTHHTGLRFGWLMDLQWLLKQRTRAERPWWDLQWPAPPTL